MLCTRGELVVLASSFSGRLFLGLLLWGLVGAFPPGPRLRSCGFGFLCVVPCWVVSRCSCVFTYPVHCVRSSVLFVCVCVCVCVWCLRGGVSLSFFIFLSIP